MREFVSWRAWDEAADDLTKELPADTYQTVSQAAEAAQRWHGDQQRPTGVPYVEHLLEALEVLVRGAAYETLPCSQPCCCTMWSRTHRRRSQTWKTSWVRSSPGTWTG